MLRQIDQVIYHLKFTVNLILLWIIALCFTQRLTYTVLSLLGRSQTDLICTLCFGVTIGSTLPVCVKTISSSVWKVLVSQRHTYPSTSMVLWCLQPVWLVFPWCPFCRPVTGLESLPQPDIIFLHTSLLWISTRIPSNDLSQVSVSSFLVGNCQTLTYIRSCKYVGLMNLSYPQYWANSFQLSV